MNPGSRARRSAATAWRPPRALWRLAVLGTFLACLAPTPGDIGGCQPARELDEDAFFTSKHAIDCERCGECNVDTQTCDRACRDERSLGEAFPEGCVPLTHDGAVCLRALLHASCSDFRHYARDRGAEIPTECDFCPGSSGR